METDASKGSGPLFVTHGSLLMIQDEETEWPTFESILNDVRARHAAEHAAREAATADLLVAERSAAEFPDPSDDIVVEDLFVGEGVPETQAVTEELIVPDPIAEETTVEEPVVHDVSESLFPGEPLPDDQETLDFVPQDEPVIETTSAEFIATPPTITDNQSFFNQVASETGEIDFDESLNPFDPSFGGIAEDVVEDDDDGWITHSLSGVDPTQREESVAPPLAGALPLSEVAPLTPFEQPLDIGASDDTESNEDSYDTEDVWDLDQEEQGGVVIPLRQPVAPDPGLTFIGLDQNLPDDLPPEPTDPQPTEESDIPTAGNTFALRPNVFTSGEVDPNTSEEAGEVAALLDPAVPPPPSGIPATDPTLPIPGVKPDDPWSTMRAKDAPEKITFWENRPKFFGGDERRKAKARREAAAAQEALPSQVAEERNCPNCGALCRVDVHDKALNRLHLSCNSCRHMWVEDGAPLS